MISYKKHGVILLVLLFVFSNAFSAYLKNVPQRITQPDGTVIHCFATGDEYHNWLHDSAGFTIIQDKESGYYVYAVLSNEELVPSKHIVGSVNPVAIGLMPNLNISESAWQAKLAVFEQDIPVRTHKKSVKKTGTINNIAFFICFADDTAGFEILTYDSLRYMFNDSTDERSNSMYNYYRTISYGNMYIKTHFYPATDGNVVFYYQDTFPRSHYKAYDAVKNPDGYTSSGSNSSSNRKNALLRKVINFYRDSVTTLSGADLDYDGDGYVDNVIFIVVGEPEGWNDLLWPHRSRLSSAGSINGKVVYDYNFLLEGRTNPGVITHEMMHTLSAPDLYRYYTDRGLTPVGVWDLMESTTDVSPQGLSAYMKYQYAGWIDDIPEITSPGTYTLYPANGTSPEGTAYMFYPDPSINEYLVFEYRKTNTNIFEGNLPGSGLLIYRINGKREGMGNSLYNGTTIFDEVYLFRPNGGVSALGDLSKAHFAKDYNRTSFSPITEPYPYYTNGNPMGNFLITDITEVGDSIQFTLVKQVDTIIVSSKDVSLVCDDKARMSFEITANIPWTLKNPNGTWINLREKTDGKGDYVIPIIAQSKNEEETSRTCTLNLYSTRTNVLYGTVIVTQFHCNYTDIVEISQNSDVKIFPNPASESLTISYPKTDDIPTISIYSITGQLLHSSTIENENTNINISEFTPGIYYLRFSSQKQSIVKSFTVK